LTDLRPGEHLSLDFEKISKSKNKKNLKNDPDGLQRYFVRFGMCWKLVDNVIPIILSYFARLLVPDWPFWPRGWFWRGFTSQHPEGARQLGPYVSLRGQDVKPSPRGSKEGFSCMFRAHLSCFCLVFEVPG
jgi:hypothetical protein